VSYKQHVVRLTPEERNGLMTLIGAGVAPARRVQRARILLKADAGVRGPRWTDASIAEALEVSARSVARVRAEYCTLGLAACLTRRAPNRVYARCFDGVAEAHLVALACSPPPDDRARWTLRLLADEVVALGIAPHTCPETVRATLKKTTWRPG
jgi:Homeodomain-like domain